MPDRVTFSSCRLLVNGIEMNVIVEGQGPDVLLVHGFPDTHQAWRKTIPALVAAGYRVIAPDTRGCGETDMPAAVRDYGIDRLVADLVGLLDALRIEKVSLVGHDWGAVQAWFLAMRHPRRVERLAVLSVGHPAAYASGGIAQKLRGWYVLFFQLRGIAERLLTAFDWALFRWTTDNPSEWPMWRKALKRPGRLTAGINYYRANLGLLLATPKEAVAMPVLGVWSDGDRFLTERQMTGSARLVAGSWRYERVDGVGHWLQLDAPERINRLLLEFLGETR